MSTAITKKREWKWTKQRRRAIELVLNGATDVEIAKELSLHRNTIFNWRHSPEFIEELQVKMAEFGTRLKLKRIQQTTKLTDVLAGKLAAALRDENLAKVGTYGREFHAMRAEERQDFGDNVKRVEGTLNVNGTQTITHKGGGSFRDFLEKHADVIDAEVVATAEDPAEAVKLMARQVLQNSDYLSELHSEDLLSSKA